MPPAASGTAARNFIKRQLAAAGWSVRNPDRHPEGQVWAPREYAANPHIEAQLRPDRPAMIVKAAEARLWVIDAKPVRGQLDEALQAAQACAAKLNRDAGLEAMAASGVAGNADDGFIAKTHILKDGAWLPAKLNGVEATGLPSPKELWRQAEAPLRHLQGASMDERRLMLAAEAINLILHNGSINAHHRAQVVTTLLLSLLGGQGPDAAQRDAVRLVDDINARARGVLEAHGQGGAAGRLQIQAPTAGQPRFRRALVETLQELLGLNIHSALRSGDDWLGAFHEMFLKHSRWAQDLGVVLTPRHITRFAARAMPIDSEDIVLDPACGTGGFLTAALEASQGGTGRPCTARGVELDDGIAAIAAANMIFRPLSAGRCSIEQGDCFAPTGRARRAATKVLMNPPFGARLRRKGTQFVDCALQQTAPQGLLFCILPYGDLVKPGEARDWRRRTLQENTLLAAVTLPADAFHPVGAPAAGLVLRKGTPHPHGFSTLWIRAESDGRRKAKGKRLPHRDEPNQLEDCLPTLQAFLAKPETPVRSVPKLMKTAPVDFDDAHFEWAPEAHLDPPEISAADIAESVDRTIREAAAYLIRNPPRKKRAASMPQPMAKARIGEAFEVRAGDFHSAAALGPGDTPLASCGDGNHGIVGRFDIPAERRHSNALTVACNGQPLTAKYRPYAFGAKSDICVLIPREAMPTARLLHFAAALNSMRWRFSYGRKCFGDKLRALEVQIPSRPAQDFASLSELVRDDAPAEVPDTSGLNWRSLRLDQLFTLQRGDFHSLKTLAPGRCATVSRTERNNGVAGRFEPPEGCAQHPAGLITISTVSGDAFVQVERFMASDNVIACLPRTPMPPAAAFFIAAMINLQKWRFSYGRQCYRNKLATLTLQTPWRDGGLDDQAMRSIVEAHPHWGSVADGRRP